VGGVGLVVGKDSESCLSFKSSINQKKKGGTPKNNRLSSNLIRLGTNKHRKPSQYKGELCPSEYRNSIGKNASAVEKEQATGVPG